MNTALAVQELGVEGTNYQLTPGVWNNIPISGAIASAGTPYWLAILGTQTGTLRFWDGSGCKDESSQQSNLTTLPSTWVSGTVGRVTNFTAVFFRRTTPQITNPGGLWDESQNFYPRLGGTPHLGAREWRWPRGSKIKFSHLQFETTVYDWQAPRLL